MAAAYQGSSICMSPVHAQPYQYTEDATRTVFVVEQLYTGVKDASYPSGAGQHQHISTDINLEEVGIAQRSIPPNDA